MILNDYIIWFCNSDLFANNEHILIFFIVSAINKVDSMVKENATVDEILDVVKKI